MMAEAIKEYTAKEQVEICPFCQSNNIYYSKKRNVFVCEDCDRTFCNAQAKVLNASENRSNGIDIFFSYGHDRNRQIVERIKQDLEKRGHHVWIDESEIKAGDYWRESILNGILKSSRIIAFLSEHSTRNPGVCLDELKIAVCVKGADVKTVLLEPEAHVCPPVTLSGVQWLDMSNWYEIWKSSDDQFSRWYNKKLEELCSVIESTESLELIGDISILKAKLSPCLYSEKEHRLLAKKYCGRSWLKNAVDALLNDPKTSACIVYGKPGSGKSAFSVNYSHYNPNVYCCLLCEWGRENTVNPAALVKTIAFRLATKLPDYRRLLLRQLEDKSRLEGKSAEDLFDYLLTYPLSAVVDGQRGAGVIVVDGLDEATKDGDCPLARMLAKCVSHLPSWVKFVFTTRPDHNVCKYFDGHKTIDIVEDVPNGYDDVKAYVVESLADKLRLVTNKLEFINKVSELSSGVMLYAELLVSDILAGVVDIEDINVLPCGLGAYYRLSMDRIFASPSEFSEVRKMLETISVAEIIPEELVRLACGYTRYKYLKLIDKVASWICHYEQDGLKLIGFSHKSVRDWLVNANQSYDYYVDYKVGALRLARYCRECVDISQTGGMFGDQNLLEYIKRHIGTYYAISAQYSELESFLVSHKNELDPYWMIWQEFPSYWDNSALLSNFWNSTSRNAFMRKLQREGNTRFLLWIFDCADEAYGISNFDRDMIAIYIDMVHLSGDYSKAVTIADKYLMGCNSEVAQDEFLSMLSVRRIHHAMFYTPVGALISQAKDLCTKLSDRFPLAYNELLFLIGGNLGVLHGDWEFAKQWLGKSIAFAARHSLVDFLKRNARKEADYYCHVGEYERAEKIILDNMPATGEIVGRYEAYLVGALGNVHTCIGFDDKAMDDYGRLLKFASENCMPGWLGHANLGIANVNYKMGNYDEAMDFGDRARSVYAKINQSWGIIMSNALFSACDCRLHGKPILHACTESVKYAEQMQYQSCISSIEEFVTGVVPYLKLYFL